MNKELTEHVQEMIAFNMGKVVRLLEGHNACLDTNDCQLASYHSCEIERSIDDEDSWSKASCIHVLKEQLGKEYGH